MNKLIKLIIFISVKCFNIRSGNVDTLSMYNKLRNWEEFLMNFLQNLLAFYCTIFWAPVRVVYEIILKLKVKVQVYRLISSILSDLYILPPGHLWAISTPRRTYSPAAISAHWTLSSHCHLCPTRYSFSPESCEAFEGEVPCPRTQHRNNVPILRGEKHDISLKILQQAGFETARQAATLSKLRALTIAPCPSLQLLLNITEFNKFGTSCCTHLMLFLATAIHNKNYSWLFNLWPNICKSRCLILIFHLIPSNWDLTLTVRGSTSVVRI